MARTIILMLAASLVFVACGGGSSPDPCEGVTCSGHGTCDSSSGEAVCTCDDGYGGDLCAECGVGYHDEDGACVVNEVCGAESCSGNGTCDDSSGLVACTCDEGHEGSQCEICSSGYQDNDGDGACLPGCATSGLDCGNHGACDDLSGVAVCTCDDGWGGADCSVEVAGIEWVAIPGGTFMMGSDSGLEREQPVHQVTVPAFEMNSTEVTVAQYQACVDAGVCSAPSQFVAYSNWGVAGREDHPVNYEEWVQAVDFCTWVGGRLPSEAEWEYAARGGGQDINYPWGDDPASCTYAVMDDGGWGCGLDRTWAVCSKTAGNTAQGLCDMAGNVWEWVQDLYHGSYDCDANPGATNCVAGGIAPSDGSAWESPSGSYRVVRGGCFLIVAGGLRAAHRYYDGPSTRYADVGFRCAR